MAIVITINRTSKDLPYYTVFIELTTEAFSVLQTESGVDIVKE